MLGRPLVIWVLSLQCEEAVRGGDQRRVVMPTEPGPPFVMVEPELALELFVMGAGRL